MISEAMMTLEIPQGILDAAHLSLPELRRELAHYDPTDLQDDLDALRELGAVWLDQSG